MNPAPSGLCAVQVYPSGHIITTGGWGSWTQVKEYDLIIGFLAELPALQIARQSHGCAVINSGQEIIVAGGTDDAYNPLDSVEIYNLASNAWRWGASLPVLNMSFTDVSGVMWAIGPGQDEVYRYEAAHDIWEHMGHVNSPGFLDKTSWVAVNQEEFGCHEPMIMN